ncbi:hypothetical protein GCM10009608_18350 [Pseudonocardia alaniniphila]
MITGWGRVAAYGAVARPEMSIKTCRPRVDRVGPPVITDCGRATACHTGTGPQMPIKARKSGPANPLAMITKWGPRAASDAVTGPEPLITTRLDQPGPPMITV